MFKLDFKFTLFEGPLSVFEIKVRVIEADAALSYVDANIATKTGSPILYHSF